MLFNSLKEDMMGIDMDDLINQVRIEKSEIIAQTTEDKIKDTLINLGWLPPEEVNRLHERIIELDTALHYVSNYRDGTKNYNKGIQLWENGKSKL